MTLDAGVLIAFERGQAWRDGARQARLATLVGSPLSRVEVLDESLAKAAGVLCGRRGTAEVIDATVVLAARATATTVLTSDPEDIAPRDPSLAIERV